jgi:phage gp46-like protein
MTIDYAKKTIVQYQGDPRLFLDGEGSFLIWRGGQCVMDQGLENAVDISLFTRLDPKTSPLGWAGNYLIDDIKQHVGSRFEEVADRPITFSGLTDISNAAKLALDWLITAGLAKEITVETTNPRYEWRRVAVRITRPDLTDKEIVLLRNGQNWIYQTTDPAHGRK